MIETKTLCAAMAFALGGCMSSGMADAPTSVRGQCSAEPAKYHVGHDATAAMGAAILKDSGARQLRWGPPDSAWTMDYREDRVNVRYNEDMVITEITCG